MSESLPLPGFRKTRFARLARATVFAWVASIASAAVSSPALNVAEEPGKIILTYAGRPAEVGRPGIPSWKAILLQDDGGNISALHVPADNPVDLSSRRRGWPITILATRSLAGVNEPDKGRENFAAFHVETMEITERSPERVVIKVAGPSRQQHYEHERTYTFSARGVMIEGSLIARVDLRRVSWDPHWDRDQVADSHQAAVPLRTQGRHGWVSALSSGSDAVTPLPEGVAFPLEAELRLRAERPTFLRIFIDKTFDTSRGARTMVNNNKDFTAIPSGLQYFEKLIGGFEGGPLPKGERDSFKVRYEFDTR